MKILAILLTIFSLFTLQPEANASNQKDNEIFRQKTEKIVAAADRYMSKHYNLSLFNEDYYIINTNDYKQMVNKYKAGNIATNQVHCFATYSSQKKAVIVDLQNVTMENYNYLLTHGLMHMYQEWQFNKDKHNPNETFHEGLNEGIAYELSNRITGMQLAKPIDHDIPFGQMATKKDVLKAVELYGVAKTVEQCTYFAREYLNMANKKLYVPIIVEKGHKH